MSVVDGQVANATTFNNAFASKTSNNTLTGVQSLSNGGSTAIPDLQQAVNDKLESSDFASEFDTAFATKDTDDLPEGATNKYFTDLRAQAAAVEDLLVNGVTTRAPSQNIVFDQLALKESLSNKGIASGYVPLNGSTKIDATYLPSYVDDVEEYADLASFPVSGETGKIYIAIDTSKCFRWTGSIYVEVSPSEVNSVFGRTGSVSAVAGDYNASQITNTPAGNIAAVTVQAALNELDFEKQPLLVNSAGLAAALSDETGTGFAVFSNSPALTGSPTAPTQSASDNSTKLATTAYVDSAVGASSGITQITGDILVGPGSGSQVGTLPTVNANVGSFGTATQTGSFTVNAKGQVTAASNTSIQIAESQVTNLVSDLALKAPLASPALTGAPTAPTAVTTTNTTQIATTAFVQQEIAAIPASSGDVSSNTATSVDSEVALFNGTSGKSIKRATGTGVAHLSSGVLSASSVVLTTEVSGTLPIANGGTNSNTALSGSSIMVSDGTKVIQGAAGTATTVLHGNASGVPTYGAVALATDVSGNLPVSNLNSGTGASASTVWRGDGTWKPVVYSESAISASDIDWSLAPSHYKTLAANTTFTFSNIGAGQTIIVHITNTASNYTVSWPAGILWTNSTAPTQTTGAKTDVYTFSRSNGVTYGAYSQNHG